MKQSQPGPCTDIADDANQRVQDSWQAWLQLWLRSQSMFFNKTLATVKETKLRPNPHSKTYVWQESKGEEKKESQHLSHINREQEEKDTVTQKSV